MAGPGRDQRGGRPGGGPRIVPRGEWPDLYMDGVQIVSNEAGVILTLLRTEPTGEERPHEEPTSIVGRIRMSPVVFQMLVQGLNQTASAMAAGQQVGDGPKH